MRGNTHRTGPGPQHHFHYVCINDPGGSAAGAAEKKKGAGAEPEAAAGKLVPAIPFQCVPSSCPPLSLETCGPTPQTRLSRSDPTPQARLSRSETHLVYGRGIMGHASLAPNMRAGTNVD